MSLPFASSGFPGRKRRRLHVFFAVHDVVWNRRGTHNKLDVLQSLISSKADLYCLVETWLTKHCTAVDVPGYSCHSVCRPVAQRGPSRGGICTSQ